MNTIHRTMNSRSITMRCGIGGLLLLCALFQAHKSIAAEPKADGAVVQRIAALRLEIEQAGLKWQPNEQSPADTSNYALGAIPFTISNPVQVSSPQGFNSLGPAALPASVLIPPSLDLRSRLQPVRNQGACGTCVAFAAVAALEAEAALYTGITTDKSEQDVVSCSGAYSSCDVGTTVPSVATFLQHWGVVPESTYPYFSGTTGVISACGLSGATQNAQSVRLKSWRGYQIDGASDLRYALYTLQRPIIATMSVWSDFYSYGSGVYAPTPSSIFEGNHAVLVVGYSDADQSFLVRNSWGPSWGQSGYFKIAYSEVSRDSRTQFAALSTAVAAEGVTVASQSATQALCTESTPGTAYCDLSVPVGKYADFDIQGEARADGNGTRSGSMQLNMISDGAECNLDYGVTFGVDNSTILSGDGFRCRPRVFGGRQIRVSLVAPNDRADAVYLHATARFTETEIAAQPTAAVCVSDTPTTAHCDMTVAFNQAYADFVIQGEARADGNGTHSGSMQLNMAIDGVACNANAGVTFGVDNSTVLSGSGFVCARRFMSGDSKRILLTAPNSSAQGIYTRATSTVTPGPPSASPVGSLGQNDFLFGEGFETSFLPSDAKPGEDR